MNVSSSTQNIIVEINIYSNKNPYNNHGNKPQQPNDDERIHWIEELIRSQHPTVGHLPQPLILPIYGDDGSMSKTEKAVTVESSRLPVFGMKRSDAAFFGIIEDGEALAKMTADISGRLHQYNTVSNVFTVLPKDVVQLSNSEQTIRTPNRMYQGKLQIRYGFLNGKQADYSSMAAYYRHYLEQKYGMKTM